MNTRDMINPKLWTPGLITFNSFDERIKVELTNENSHKIEPLMLKLIEEKEARLASKGA